MLKNLRPYKATTDYVTTMHYSANAVVYYCTTECYVATVHYSLGVFATVRVGGAEETWERVSPTDPSTGGTGVITREVNTTVRMPVGLIGQIGLV